MSGTSADASAANAQAVEAMAAAAPILTDVMSASDALPGMRSEMILASGPPMRWEEYVGGQRRAILGAAMFEGLAASLEEADERLHAGEIAVEPCHDHACVGSVTGVTSASMPVLVVQDAASGSRGHCLLYEGSQRQRLTYGVWNHEVHQHLMWMREVLGPTLSRALRSMGGIPLMPIMRRALGMGDELHSRNTAATAVLLQKLIEPVLDTSDGTGVGKDVLRYIASSDLFFLHVGMAVGKCVATTAHGVPGSSIVTAMALSEKQFGIRVAGTGDEWFTSSIPPLKAKLFEGYTPDDLTFMGGESLIMETIGLGGLAAAAAFSLQDYSLGTPDGMVQSTLSMYNIAHTEHPELKIPALQFRGVPFGIDAGRVAASLTTPVIHMGAALREGGHAGAGLLLAPVEPFAEAAATLMRKQKL